MPEFFLELFSEEIPARMQRSAAVNLERLISEHLKPLSPNLMETYFGPRRIAIKAELADGVAASSSAERGPRVTAPEQALAGFLRKHNATRDQLRQEGDFWVLDKSSAAVSPAELIAGVMPGLLRRFPWPKSMRWGGTSAFTWVRPLRRIVCLVDGQVVPFDLRDGDDDGHGLVASNLTEGHRFHAPGSVAVTCCSDWQAKLRERRVLVNADERKHVISDALAQLAGSHGVTVVDDPGLLDEVAGLVEWPVVLSGRIDEAFMDLPPEVMQVSMRVNQRYFALRNLDRSAAPLFAFASNIEACDGGAAIIAGNQRVLSARFSDARHFWDLDQRTPLDSFLEKLDQTIFHAKLGSQGERSRRIGHLAEQIAQKVGADPSSAKHAGELSKADLLTGMVGEFPELQGVMGGYYARQENQNSSVADAIRDHYAPRGLDDAVPVAPVSIAVALADKLDQLAGFFAIEEKPTGSSDPYALRRAALGVIRIIRENRLRLALGPVIDSAVERAKRNLRTVPQLGGRFTGGAVTLTIGGRLVPGGAEIDIIAIEIIQFLAERLRVQLRTEGARHDVLMAVFAAGADDDIVRLLERTEAVATLVGTEDGINLLAAYRRAANILRIEEKKDGPHDAVPEPSLFAELEEAALAFALDQAAPTIDAHLAAEDYADAMSTLAQLRAPLDAFFEQVTVNAPEPELRRNRLRLLARVRAIMDRVADFSKIEG